MATTKNPGVLWNVAQDIGKAGKALARANVGLSGITSGSSSGTFLKSITENAETGELTFNYDNPVTQDVKDYSDKRAVHLFTCDTGAGTQNKALTLVQGPGNYTEENGTLIYVKFDNSNTASSPKLQAPGKSAVPIYVDSGTTAPGTTEATSWKAGKYIGFVYHSGAYRMLAAGATYTPGANVSISPTNEISATDTTYSAANKSIDISSAKIKVNLKSSGSYLGLDTDSSTGGLYVDSASLPLSTATTNALNLKANQSGSYDLLVAGRSKCWTHAVAGENQTKYIRIGKIYYTGTQNVNYVGVTLSVEIRDTNGTATRSGLLWVSPKESDESSDLYLEYITLSKRSSDWFNNVEFYAHRDSGTPFNLFLYAKVTNYSQIFVSIVNDPTGSFVPDMVTESSEPQHGWTAVKSHLLRSTYGTAIGSQSTPVYVDANGIVRECVISGQVAEAERVFNQTSNQGLYRTINVESIANSLWGVTAVVSEDALMTKPVSKSFLEAGNLSIYKKYGSGQSESEFDLQLGCRGTMSLQDTSTGLLMGHTVVGEGKSVFLNPDRLYIAASSGGTVTGHTTIKANEISTTGMIYATGYTSAGSESPLVSGIDFHGIATSAVAAVKWHDSGTSGQDYALKVVTSMPATVEPYVFYVI